jgi:hypothetical protein
MNKQPRDILYCIIAYLAYTPDTARLGRVCKQLDSVPHWYERSGHVQPHERYVISELVCGYYVDGRVKEHSGVWFDDPERFHHCTRHLVTYHYDTLMTTRLSLRYVHCGERLDVFYKGSRIFEVMRVAYNRIVTIQITALRKILVLLENTLDHTSTELTYECNSRQLLHQNSTDSAGDYVSYSVYEYEQDGSVTVYLPHSNNQYYSVYPTDLPDLFDFDYGVFKRP